MNECHEYCHETNPDINQDTVSDPSVFAFRFLLLDCFGENRRGPLRRRWRWRRGPCRRLRLGSLPFCRSWLAKNFIRNVYCLQLRRCLSLESSITDKSVGVPNLNEIQVSATDFLHRRPGVQTENPVSGMMVHGRTGLCRCRASASSALALWRFTPVSKGQGGSAHDCAERNKAPHYGAA